MKRWVSRQPASAQLSSKLESLQLKGKRRRVDTVLHKENVGTGISGLPLLTCAGSFCSWKFWSPSWCTHLSYNKSFSLFPSHSYTCNSLLFIPLQGLQSAPQTYLVFKKPSPLSSGRSVMHCRCLHVAAVARHNRLQEEDGWAPGNFFSCPFLEAGMFCCWFCLTCWYMKPLKHHLNASPFIPVIVRVTGRGMQNRFRSFYKIHLISSLCLPIASSKLERYHPFKQRKSAGRDHLHLVAAVCVLSTASGCVRDSLCLHPFSHPCRIFGKKIPAFWGWVYSWPAGALVSDWDAGCWAC